MGEVVIEVDAGERQKLHDRAIDLLERAGIGTAEERRLANLEVKEIKARLGVQWLRDFKA